MSTAHETLVNHTPPRLPLLIADRVDIHPQSLARINRGEKPPGLKLGAELARIAREEHGLDVDICDWIPALLDEAIWAEITHAVDRRRLARKSA